MILHDWSPEQRLPIPGVPPDTRVYPLRVYVARTRLFYNGDARADLGKLHAEAQSIIDLLVTRGLVPADGPGGYLTLLREPQ